MRKSGRSDLCLLTVAIKTQENHISKPNHKSETSRCKMQLTEVGFEPTLSLEKRSVKQMVILET